MASKSPPSFHLLFPTPIFIVLALVSWCSAAEDWRQFENKKQGYRLNLPTGWESLETGKDFLVTFVAPIGAPNAGSRRRAASLSVVSAILPAKAPLDGFLDVAMEEEPKKYKDFKLLEKGATRLGGRDARRYAFTFTDANGLKLETITILTMLDGAEYYSLSISIDPPTRDETMSVVKKILVLYIRSS